MPLAATIMNTVFFVVRGPRNLDIVGGKLVQRLRGTRSSIGNTHNAAWMVANTVSSAKIATRINADAWAEAQAFASDLRTRADPIIATIPYSGRCRWRVRASVLDGADIPSQGGVGDRRRGRLHLREHSNSAEAQRRQQVIQLRLPLFPTSATREIYRHPCRTGFAISHSTSVAMRSHCRRFPRKSIVSTLSTTTATNPTPDETLR